MKKRVLSILVAVLLVSAFALPAFAADELIVYPAKTFGGAFIDTTKLTVGESYTVEFNVLPDEGSNGGFRVRYCDGTGESGSFNHNDGTNGAHSSEAAQVTGTAADGLVANQVPAQIPNGTVPGNTEFKLTVNFTLGADIPDLDPKYMDYIGFFGSQGATDYTVLSATLYDADGNVIATATTPVAEEVPEETEEPEETAEETNVKTGDNTFVFFAFGILAVAGAAAIVVARKIKA